MNNATHHLTPFSTDFFSIIYSWLSVRVGCSRCPLPPNLTCTGAFQGPVGGNGNGNSEYPVGRYRPLSRIMERGDAFHGGGGRGRKSIHPPHVPLSKPNLQIHILPVSYSTEKPRWIAQRTRVPENRESLVRLKRPEAYPSLWLL